MCPTVLYFLEQGSYSRFQDIQCRVLIAVIDAPADRARYRLHPEHDIGIHIAALARLSGRLPAAYPDQRSAFRIQLPFQYREELPEAVIHRALAEPQRLRKAMEVQRLHRDDIIARGELRRLILLPVAPLCGDVLMELRYFPLLLLVVLLPLHLARQPLLLQCKPLLGEPVPVRHIRDISIARHEEVRRRVIEADCAERAEGP